MCNFAAGHGPLIIAYQMKRIAILISLAFVAFVSSLAAMAEKKEPARIRFEQTSHNFGVIKESAGSVSYEFTFYNDGGSPLVITEATASCGCTRPEYPDRPIAPGKKGKIRVTYNPAGRPGPIDRNVTVRTNGKPKKVILKLLGNVTPK